MKTAWKFIIKKCPISLFLILLITLVQVLCSAEVISSHSIKVNYRFMTNGWSNSMIGPLSYTVFHSDWSHYLANLPYLLVYLVLLELFFGSVKLIRWYFMCCLITNIASILFALYYDRSIAVIGFSGMSYAAEATIIGEACLVGLIGLQKYKTIPSTIVFSLILFFGVSTLINTVVDKAMWDSMYIHLFGYVSGIIFVSFSVGQYFEGRIE